MSFCLYFLNSYNHAMFSLQVRNVLKLLEHPFQEAEGLQEVKEDAEEEGATATAAVCAQETGSRQSYCSKPPLWAAELCVT